MRITKAMKQRCVDAVNTVSEYLLRLGATEIPEDFQADLAGRRFRLETKAGTLCLHPCTMDGSGFTIFGRFKEKEKARVFFGFDAVKYPIFTTTRIAPHSGKWNFHYFNDEVEAGIDAFKRELQPLLQ